MDEIGEMIGNLEQSSGNISQQMESDMQLTQHAVEQARQTGVVLETINKSALAIAELNTQIASDTEAQDRSSGAIQKRLQVVESLNNQTSQNTDSAREAALDLDKMVDDLQRVANRFKC